jgi:hypothetical protein
MIVLTDDQAGKLRSLLVTLLEGDRYSISEVEQCLEYVCSNHVDCPFERKLAALIVK